MHELHEYEQYFFDRPTLAYLADFIEQGFTHPCCLCAPLLGQALVERGVAVTILDRDERFARLPGFRRYDLFRPHWLEKSFDLILCDPPFFQVSLSQLFTAIRMLSHYNLSQPLLVSYLRRRSANLLGAFSPFNLSPTGYSPTYQTVQALERNEIEFFQQFGRDLGGPIEGKQRILKALLMGWLKKLKPLSALRVALYGAGLLVLSWLASCQARPAEESQLAAESSRLTTTPSAKPANKLGVHLLLADGRHDWPQALWPGHLKYARQAVGEGGFVVELVRLDDLDPGRWQQLMNLCAQLQLIPVLRLATTHDAQKGGWTAPPQDADGRYHTVAAQYAQFVTALKWPTEAHYVIVGNEPNHGGEWGGRPDPAAYARFLLDVADALHAADPQAKVLNAGFDAYTPHTGSLPFNDGQYYLDEESFLDQMMAAQPEVFTRLDAWASHAYPLGPFSEAPWQQRYQVDLINDARNPNHVEPPAGLYNRGVNGYEWELWKLSTYGLPPLPVLITETGWRHAESVDPTSPDNGRPLPSAETVARYMELALKGNQGRYPEWPESGWTPWLRDERVIGVVFFAFNGYPAYWGHTNWLVLNRQGQVLATYAPFERLRLSR